MFIDCHDSENGQNGFMLKFGNGWTFSVRFGFGNYCQNQHKKNNNGECKNAEIAAYDLNNNWFDFQTGSIDRNGYHIKGWCSTDEVMKYMETVSKLPNSVNKNKMALEMNGV
mgnify:CR=1 FL=1